MTTTPYYKVTGPSGESVHSGTYQWSLPHGDTPGEWSPRIDDPILCATGYHLTVDPMQWPKIGMRIWGAEPEGIVERLDDKIVTTSARLVVERPELVPTWWHDVERFVATIADVPWHYPQCQPDAAWVTRDTRVAAEDAVRRAAASGIRNAAGNTAWQAAERVARNAARDVAINAAGNAAWQAAERVARDAAEDASIMAIITACGDLDLDQRYRDHAADRWNVWQSGHGLICDVDGVLYVYRGS